MFYQDAQHMMPHILMYKAINKFIMSRTSEFLYVNYEIEALFNNYLIFLLRNLILRCRYAHKLLSEKY